jgi:cardiolipin synthase A/B
MARRAGRRGGWLAALVAVVCCLGCSGTAALVTTASPSPSPCGSAACAPGDGTRGVQVFVEPDAGRAPILRAIEGAKSSIWVEVYLLTDSSTIQKLEEAAARGVDVRVLLETAPYGDGATSAQVTLAKLNAAGVHAQPADPAFHYTHAKTMLVDGGTAYIMTCNLTASGLGGTKQTTNREYGAIDTDPSDVAEVRAIFQADWNRTAPQLGDPNLVVSPVDARPKLLALIAGARTSLQVEDEEMLDAQSEDALVAAARRGVAAEVVLPLPSASSPPPPDLARLAAGGVRIRYSATLYMHAKLIVQDGGRAFVGSENFSANSLDANREVGVLIADPTALTALETAFASDWDGGVPYAG